MFALFLILYYAHESHVHLVKVNNKYFHVNLFYFPKQCTTKQNLYLSVFGMVMKNALT